MVVLVGGEISPSSGPVETDSHDGGILRRNYARVVHTQTKSLFLSKLVFQTFQLIRSIERLFAKVWIFQYKEVLYDERPTLNSYCLNGSKDIHYS